MILLLKCWGQSVENVKKLNFCSHDPLTMSTIAFTTNIIFLDNDHNRLSTFSILNILFMISCDRHLFKGIGAEGWKRNVMECLKIDPMRL